MGVSILILAANQRHRLNQFPLANPLLHYSKRYFEIVYILFERSSFSSWAPLINSPMIYILSPLSVLSSNNLISCSTTDSYFLWSTLLVLILLRRIDRPPRFSLLKCTVLLSSCCIVVESEMSGRSLLAMMRNF